MFGKTIYTYTSVYLYIYNMMHNIHNLYYSIHVYIANKQSFYFYFTPQQHVL